VKDALDISAGGATRDDIPADYPSGENKDVAVT
jgi:uncharacterized protein (DUF433 family)